LILTLFWSFVILRLFYNFYSDVTSGADLGILLAYGLLNSIGKYMLGKQKKQNIIKKYQTHADDTGSSEVQIAILSAEIEELSGHLKQHHKDHSSRRGLLRKVGERRRLLRYLKKENPKSYEELVKKLKLKLAKALERSVPVASFGAVTAAVPKDDDADEGPDEISLHDTEHA